MDLFTNTVHIPVLFAVLAIIAEFLGALGLIVGLGTRLAAFGLACNMAAMHAQHGFFMNWHATQTREGVEFPILAIGLALALMISGGGRHSLDRVLTARLTTDDKAGLRLRQSVAAPPAVKCPDLMWIVIFALRCKNARIVFDRMRDRIKA